MNLKSDSAPGWDNISTKYLKLVKNHVIPIITHLTNLCFKTGIFPELLKKSLITPVFKGGDREDINNYRPISVLPALSKIIEKALNTRLLHYLSTFNLLSPSQFGFRNGISTEDAVRSLSSFICNQLDKGNKCLSVFLGLKKAFDTVSIPILLQKLEKMGVRGNQLSIFKNYLFNRMQKVKLGEYTSDYTAVSYGVPQGSVLGPTLFLIYINDLCNMNILGAKIFSYADDTAVVFSGPSWNATKTDAERGMFQVANWLKFNLLTLNTSKTEYICFQIKNHLQPKDLKIKIHVCKDVASTVCACPFIKKANQTKYLGVIMDQRLSWYLQIENISSRIRKFIRMFKSLRHMVPNSTSLNSSKNLLNEIYIAFVQSVITYCIPIWGGACKTRFIEVERAQRGLLKVMYFKKRRYSTDRLYHISNLLSVRKLYIVKTILMKHKTLIYDPKLESQRRKDVIFKVPRTKTSFTKLQYSIQSANLYNKINKELQIYSKTYYECKTALSEFIKQIDYDKTESLLKLNKL